MTAEILAVGTELLLGDILNTNAQFLSQELAKLGINVFYQTVVGDNADRLLAAYETAFSRADVIIATGGLGPTEDDLTKETAARFFGLEMALDNGVWEGIQSFFTTQHLNMTQNNQKQAVFPIGCTILRNDNGTAPGCLLERDGKMLFLLPGPPNEAVPMYLNSVRPILKEKSDSRFFSKTLKICGIGESSAENMLRELIDGQSNPTIAPYAKTSEVWFRVTAKATDENEAAELMRPVLEQMRGILGGAIYGEDDDTLAGVVIRSLQEKNLKIALAESCTAGLLTSAFVDCPGASNVLLEGAVTYANESKIKRLGVKPETLEAFGAVSEQTAAEMAEGIAKATGADIAAATTGIAGPDGGTQEKPVGLVYLGFYNQGEVTTLKLQLSGNRQKIRERAVVNALNTIRGILQNGGSQENH